MEEQHNPDTTSADTHSANPGYALGQLAHALTTNQTHPDPATRERAARKIDRWIQVLQGMISGTLSIGSRTPVATTTAWATLEVTKGGFATGSLLAEGPLQPHEVALLQKLPPVAPGSERAAINSYYLNEQGFTDLQGMLTSGRYRVNVPEEGALLVMAWLADQNRTEEARALLDVLGPFLGHLRFYPVPAERPLDIATNVFRQDVGQTIVALREVKVSRSRAREREDILIWAPLYDRVVALFAETIEGDMPFVRLSQDGEPQRRPNGHYMVEGGWPCQHYPAGWTQRARALLDDYRQERSIHQHSTKPEQPTKTFALLRSYLERCITEPQQLTGREVGQIRAILAAFALRRGLPGSPRHKQLRREQMRLATIPTTVDLVQVLLHRLEPLPQDEGLDDLDAALKPITTEEANAFGLVEGQSIPPTLERKVERSLAAPIEVLVDRKIIPSSEALALIIPQLSAGARVASVVSPDLRRLYSALYTAFQRRRSLLLFNLQHQVTFDELPWVKAIEPYRARDERAKALAYDLLQHVVMLAVTTFPQQILPNTLLQEIRALAESAGLALPIADEVAADIFMGTFSEKYLRAAQWAGQLLAGSLYERYYGLSYADVLQINDVAPSRYGTPTSETFTKLCHKLAGVDEITTRWSVARNGTIIEQEQILTTHNLAVLFDTLRLYETLGSQLDPMARRCFAWVCAEQQVKRGPWKSDLRALKNAAYAWRQMIFFLSLMPSEQVTAFIMWTEQHLTAQPITFQEYFRPALDGLISAATGHSITSPARRFLGWTTERHWLMPEV